MIQPGRTLPPDYQIKEAAFQANKKLPKDTTFYIVGGLYGNPWALKALKHLLKEEEGPIHCCFNGDYHWFDFRSADFMKIEQFVQHYDRLLGNVEAECCRQEATYGCGCSYPATVPAATVARSNAIHQKLKRTARQFPQVISTYQHLKKIQRYTLGDLGVLVSHGDEQALAGWQCSEQNIRQPKRQRQLENFAAQKQIKVFACTHTCSPVIYAGKNVLLVNNGASGMPSLRESMAGLVTRLSPKPHPAALYQKEVQGYWVELVPVAYDVQAMLAWFDRVWPLPSAAALSYRKRLSQGVEQSLPVITI